MKRFAVRRLPERLLLALTILSCGLALSADPPAASKGRAASVQQGSHRAQRPHHAASSRLIALRDLRPAR